MKSCSLSIVLLVSTLSSISATDQTGLKIRITDRALDVLKDFGLKALKQLVNKQFPDFSLLCGCNMCRIKGFTLTNLTVDPEQVVLGFQEKSGLQLEIRDLYFTGKLEQELPVYWFQEFMHTGTVAFEGKDVSATIGLKLRRTQRGRLRVEIPTCEVRAEFGATASGRVVGPVWDLLRFLIHDFINTKLCSTVQMTLVNIVNFMLDDVSMQLHKVLNMSFLSRIVPDVSVDLSLSADVSVSSCSLDLPLRGLVWQGVAVDVGAVPVGPDPVFSEAKKMAYVGISELFFNSAASLAHRLGPFQLSIPEGPVEVNLTQAPVVSISQSGLCVDLKATAWSLRDAPGAPVAADCRLQLKVELKGNRLTLVIQSSKCNIQPETLKGRVMKPIVNYFIKCKTKGFLKSWFDEGLPIPLPEGLHFTRGKIVYHTGFLVVGGNLDFTPN
ncbi:phospholipid transfer protein-like [Betta splendens]|uniref:Bactericidal permeability-increasing protein n=1 Tax=Betta splendens TaxID=158456 RepID=A0A6P7N6Q6_BETSP|nr:phospholipid transfer protein-like [Betta splendens]